jgi:hypothetical protein
MGTFYRELTWVDVANNLGIPVEAHWPLNDAVDAITTTAGSVAEIKGGSSGTYDHMISGENSLEYLEEKKPALGSLPGNSISHMHAGNGTATSTTNEILLEAILSSTGDASACCWTLFPQDPGVGGTQAARFIQFGYRPGEWGNVGFGAELVSRSQQDLNTDGGANTYADTRASAAKTFFTNDGNPTLWTQTVSYSGTPGDTATVKYYRNDTLLHTYNEVSYSNAGAIRYKITLDWINTAGYSDYNNGGVPFAWCTWQHAMAFNGELSLTDIQTLYNAGI